MSSIQRFLQDMDLNFDFSNLLRNNCFRGLALSLERVPETHHSLLDGKDTAVKAIHGRSEHSSLFLVFRFESGPQLFNFRFKNDDLGLSFSYFGLCMILLRVGGYVEGMRLFIG